MLRASDKPVGPLNQFDVRKAQPLNSYGLGSLNISRPFLILDTRRKEIAVHETSRFIREQELRSIHQRHLILRVHFIQR